MNFPRLNSILPYCIEYGFIVFYDRSLSALLPHQIDEIDVVLCFASKLHFKGILIFFHLILQMNCIDFFGILLFSSFIFEPTKKIGFF